MVRKKVQPAFVPWMRWPNNANVIMTMAQAENRPRPLRRRLLLMGCLLFFGWGMGRFPPGTQGLVDGKKEGTAWGESPYNPARPHREPNRTEEMAREEMLPDR